MAGSFVNLVKRNAAQALKLSDAHSDKFLELLRELRDRIAARAMQPSNRPLDAFTLARIEAETKAAISVLELKATDIYDVAARQQVESAVDHIGAELDELAIANGDAALSVVPDAAMALADSAQGLLANHFETSLERYGGDLLNKVRRDLFVAMRTGQPVNDVVRGIASDRGPMGTVGRSNAERLVRTETSNAYGAAVHNGIDQLAQAVPGIRKTWVHIGSYPCPVCIPLDGTSRPTDGTWTIHDGKRTRKVVHPPAHPHCVCRVVASKPSWDAAIERFGYKARS